MKHIYALCEPGTREQAVHSSKWARFVVAVFPAGALFLAV